MRSIEKWRRCIMLFIRYIRPFVSIVRTDIRTTWLCLCAATIPGTQPRCGCFPNRTVSRGSAKSATPGWVTESHWDSRKGGGRFGPVNRNAVISQSPGLGRGTMSYPGSSIQRFHLPQRGCACAPMRTQGQNPSLPLPIFIRSRRDRKWVRSIKSVKRTSGFSNG